jgi:hypothetical protein
MHFALSEEHAPAPQMLRLLVPSRAPESQALANLPNGLLSRQPIRTRDAASQSAREDYDQVSILRGRNSGDLYITPKPDLVGMG